MKPPSTKRHAPRGGPGGGGPGSGPPKRGRPGGGASAGGHAKKARPPPRRPPPPHSDSDGADASDDGDISDEDVRFVVAHGAKLAFLMGDDLVAEEGRLEKAGGRGPKRKEAAADPAADPAALSDDDDQHGGGGGADDDKDGEGDPAAARAYEAAPRPRLPVSTPDEVAAAAAAARPRAPKLPLVGLDGKLLLPGGAGSGAGGASGRASAKAVAAAAAVQGIAVLEDGGGDAEEEEEEEEGEEQEGGGDPAMTSESESEWGEEGEGADRDGADGDGADGGSDLPPPLPPPTPAPASAAKAASLPARGADDPGAARARLARLATKVLASPEARLPHLRALVAECGAPDPVTGRLAMLSAAAVFRDVAPGYRIRVDPAGAAGGRQQGGGAGGRGGAAPSPTTTPADPSLTLATDAALSKEVRALRAYEAGLLAAYQAFLRTVLAASGGKGAGTLAAATVGGGESPAATARARAAVRCMAELVTALPHFNFAGDLLRALVARAADGSAPACITGPARAALHALLASGNPGKGGGGTVGAVRGGSGSARLRRDAAQLVAGAVSASRCRCAPGLLAPLLAVDLASLTMSVPKAAGGDGAAAGPNLKRGKKAALRAAAAARAARAADPVAAAKAAAATAPDAADLAVLTSETAEAVFEAYFRVLKHALALDILSPGAPGGPLTSRALAARAPLLPAALAGLAAGAPALSVDYFPDLHACLARLLASPRLPPAERAAALDAASATAVGGLADALTVDRGHLFSALYTLLGACPLARALGGGGDSDASTPPSPPGLPPPEPTAALVTRCAARLVVGEARRLDAGRAAALAHRLAGAALLCSRSDPPLALGLLAVLDAAGRRSRALRDLVRRGAGWGGRDKRGGADGRVPTKPPGVTAADGGESDDDDGPAAPAAADAPRRSAALPSSASPHDLDAAAAALGGGLGGGGERGGSGGAGVWEVGALAHAAGAWGADARVRAAAASLGGGGGASGAATPRSALLSHADGPEGVAAAAAAAWVPPPLPSARPHPRDLLAARAALDGWWRASTEAGGVVGGAGDRAAAAAAAGEVAKIVGTLSGVVVAAMLR